MDNIEKKVLLDFLSGEVLKVNEKLLNMQKTIDSFASNIIVVRDEKILKERQEYINSSKKKSIAFAGQLLGLLTVSQFIEQYDSKMEVKKNEKV